MLKKKSHWSSGEYPFRSSHDEVESLVCKSLTFGPRGHCFQHKAHYLCHINTYCSKFTRRLSKVHSFRAYVYSLLHKAPECWIECAYLYKILHNLKQSSCMSLQILLKNSVIASSVDQVDSNGRAGRASYFIIHRHITLFIALYYSLLAN